MINRRGTIEAIRVLNECGIPDLRNFSLEDLVFGRGAIVQYEAIEGAEGRIVFNGEDAMITVNSSIENISKPKIAERSKINEILCHEQEI